MQADVHRLDLVDLEQVAEHREDMGDFEFTADALGFFLVDIRNGDYFGIRDIPIVPEVVLADLSNADDANLDLLRHVVAPYCL